MQLPSLFRAEFLFVPHRPPQLRIVSKRERKEVIQFSQRAFLRIVHSSHWKFELSHMGQSQSNINNSTDIVMVKQQGEDKENITTPPSLKVTLTDFIITFTMVFSCLLFLLTFLLLSSM